MWPYILGRGSGGTLAQILAEIRLGRTGFFGHGPIG